MWCAASPFFLLIAASCSGGLDNETPDLATAESAKKPVAETPVFEPGAMHGVLPLSICIETLGGLCHPVLRQGSTLPVEYREAFSTARDNQVAVDVFLFQGERALSRDNRALADLRLDGIPAAPRGVPQIELVFAVDASGLLTAHAKDLATGRQQRVAISGAQAALSESEIRAMLMEAKNASAEDAMLREWVDTRNQLDDRVRRGRSALSGLPADDAPSIVQRCERELAAAELALSLSTEPGNPEALKSSLASLDAALHDLARALYK